MSQDRAADIASEQEGSQDRRSGDEITTTQSSSSIPSGQTRDAGKPKWAIPSNTSGGVVNFIAALIAKGRAARPDMMRPIQTTFNETSLFRGLAGLFSFICLL